MEKSSLGLRTVVAGVLITAATSLFAQPAITLPPNGDNQKSTVSQQIGMVNVTIDYNSPNVTSPTGENRTGKNLGTARSLRPHQSGVRTLQGMSLARRSQRKYGVHRLRRREDPGAAAESRLVRTSLHRRPRRMDCHLFE